MDMESVIDAEEGLRICMKADDLISRQAAIDKLRNNLAYMQTFGVDRSITLIEEVPSADVVGVVRCKDCNDYQPNFHWCKLHDSRMEPTDYCSYGETRSQ